MKVLQDRIFLRHHDGPEYLVPLPMELSYRAVTPMSHGPTTAVAVYRYEKSNAVDVHVYKLEGVRVFGFHLTAAEPELGLVCPNCLHEYAMPGCGKCGCPELTQSG